jgi:OOP family OmpA-OmpF porin
VGSTETVAQDRIGFGLMATYLSRPIQLQVPSAGPLGGVRPVIDNEVNTTFLFAYGLTDRLELDLALPVTVYQDGDGTSPFETCNPATSAPCTLPTTATRDMRFGVTYAFLRRPRKHPWRHDASGFGVVGRFEMVAPTGDDNAFATEPSAVYVPSVSVDYRSHRFFVGGEVGLRIRPTTDFIGARIGTQGMFAAGVGVDVLKRELLSVTAELRWMPVFAEQGNISQTAGGLQSVGNGNYISPAEWMVTARTAPWEGGDISFHLGIGGAIADGVDATSGNLVVAPTTPRFRIALGLTFTPRGRDTDGDGIPDAIDRCPLEAAPKSVGDGTGCPP